MDDDELPFGAPPSPAREAWRRLFGQPPPPTPGEAGSSRREIDAALERIHEAVGDGNVESVIQILRECPDLTGPAYGDRLLECAIRYDQRAVVDALIGAGIPVDSIDESGGTPLMEAAWRSRLEIARYLLQAGADPDIVAEEDGSYGHPLASGLCALYCALYKGNRDLIDLLEPITSPEIRKRAYEAVERRREWDAADLR